MVRLVLKVLLNTFLVVAIILHLLAAWAIFYL